MSINRTARLVLALVVLGGGVASLASPAAALVRFGHNVYVGGHDFSNQTYDSRHRALIHLYDRTPPHEGCVWRKEGHGGRVKICHLRRIRSR